LVFVLERHYGLTRSQIGEAVQGIMSLVQVNCNRALFAKALPLFMGHPSLSFEDCCLATYADLNDARPLWTFDKGLAKYASAAELVPSL